MFWLSEEHPAPEGYIRVSCEVAREYAEKRLQQVYIDRENHIHHCAVKISKERNWIRKRFSWMKQWTVERTKEFIVKVGNSNEDEDNSIADICEKLRYVNIVTYGCETGCKCERIIQACDHSGDGMINLTLGEVGLLGMRPTKEIDRGDFMEDGTRYDHHKSEAIREVEALKIPQNESLIA